MNRLDLERSDAYHYGMQATHPAREEASAALDPIRYSSVEELQSDLSRIWDVQITQSDPGALAVALSYRSIGNCLALRTESDRSLVCAGQRAENQWILTPITADCASGFYRGRQLETAISFCLIPAAKSSSASCPGIARTRSRSRCRWSSGSSGPSTRPHQRSSGKAGVSNRIPRSRVKLTGCCSVC